MMNNDRVYYSHDAEVRAVRTMTQVMALCLMIGLGIGAALALLFAPSSGEKTRQDLAKSMNNGREAMEPIIKRLEEELLELRQRIDERLTPA